MLRSSYRYDLPEELIAQIPIEKRDMSRLMVLDRTTGYIHHRVFGDLIGFLTPGDALVINDTKVIPARLYGTNPGHSGVVETLLLERRNGDVWKCLVKPGKKAKTGDELVYSDKMKGIVEGIGEEGERQIRFVYNGNFLEILDEIGTMPLPPYIKEKLKDGSRYQTVYALHEGSAAAPTAGLHFTPGLLSDIEKKGVKVIRTCLHVGLGTFRPVKENNILDHKMHTERISLSQIAADEINEVKGKGGRIIAVGTTSCRLLESCADEKGILHPFEGETGIFIYPSYKFKIIDGLITNFHLPESTLIMLVSAFAGYENTMAAYKKAVEERYRFFSFGDAMFIV
ncbi:MAG: tRNA preQ1(34) S-adenosylmethionine ribosyltransferase-isomerase QueA [Clostridiales bacterium]|jgi:S-adenosylmethionine:tRNA ribosyltransferase-isomerase|nr:tRNA preQ1(34) S-adenosylmethionine ribosyltransferase-isomerase QueA [Clostridiales bacterium]